MEYPRFKSEGKKLILLQETSSGSIDSRRIDVEDLPQDKLEGLTKLSSKELVSKGVLVKKSGIFGLAATSGRRLGKVV